MSARSDFLTAYPQCRALIQDDAIPLSRFLSFQLAYAVLLASGESFWRGYVLFGLERWIGRLPALLYMASLYSLSHYGKPYLETSASFVAGCAEEASGSTSASDGCTEDLPAPMEPAGEPAAP